MSQATHGIPCPLFVAVTYDGESIAADDNLAVVLEQLRKLHDPDDGEELAVWRDGSTIAAVARADGSIHVFDKQAAQEAPPKAHKNASKRPRCPQ
jgi:hypothetical protein